MELDYQEIGRRIAHRRKQLKLKQAETEERAGIAYKYLSNIERGVSIPSTEVIMRLSLALETTPDEFLVGTVRKQDERWKDVAEQLRTLNDKQLKHIESLIPWALEQEYEKRPGHFCDRAVFHSNTSRALPRFKSFM